jgi:hypothetical protein
MSSRIIIGSSIPESIKEQVIETLKSKKFTRNQLIVQIIDLHHLSWSEANGIAYNILLDSRVQLAGMDEENNSIYRISNDSG